MGYKNREEAGLNWCKSKGFDGTNYNQDCGNWYFKFHCVTSNVLPDFFTVDALSCQTSSDLPTIEYLIKDGAYYSAKSDCTQPLCKRDKDEITELGSNLISFQRVVGQWDMDIAEASNTGKTLIEWTDPVTRIRWRIDRQTPNISWNGRLYHLFAVQVGSVT
jgi:hypothetical protein